MSYASVGPVAVLNAPTQTKAIVPFALAIHSRMANNPRFPNPIPTLDVFEADIAALADAETKAASGTKGMATMRDAKRNKVRAHLVSLRNYVQSVAAAQPTAAEAAAVIEDAAMAVRKTAKRDKPALRAMNGRVSGSVVIEARAVAPDATYFWQFSLDQQTWTDVPVTMQAKTSLAGLTSARTYYFRFRALTRAGAVDFSDVVSLLVR